MTPDLDPPPEGFKDMGFTLLIFPVPEPGTALLVGLGLAAMAVGRRLGV